MPKDTITFELGGRVDIREFEKSFSAFRRLITALTPQKAGVTWVVEDLQAGSAAVTFRGEADVLADVERIVTDYEKIGYALAHNEAAPSRNSRIAKAVNAIMPLTETMEYVRFQTPAVEHTIYGNGKVPSRPGASISIGAITGRIQTLSNRGALRFNLYDTLHDKAIACYLTQGQEELMREAWGKRARVSGTITRETNKGRPIAIRQILRVETLREPVPGSYKRARGAIPWKPGDKRAEEIIRELRDA